MFSVSLIIPTYNEAQNLPLLIEEIEKNLDKNKIDLEYIVVDDNSPDQTWAVAEELAEKYPLQIIRRAKKLGLGSAVIAGFEKSTRPYLGVMDADLSHDPKILNELILSLDQYDLTIGSRFQKTSSVENWQWRRKATSLVGVFFAKLLTGINDPLSGYFFLRKDLIQNIKLKTSGYKILFEILVKTSPKKIKEIPFIFRNRKNSSSKLNIGEYFLFLKQLLIYAFYKMAKNFKKN